MGQDFESEFNSIINSNNFAEPESYLNEEQEVALDEVAHVLECMNETSMAIAGLMSEALETGTPLAFPGAALAIFRALHALHEEFLTTMVECDCEECQEEENDD